MDESGKWEAKSQFQSSQPVRVGSAQGREQAVNKKVSIIPTREGWVMNMHYVSCLVCGFNHPNPRGLGHCTYY